MGRLATDLRGCGWHVIEADVEGMRTPEAFARHLCMRIEAQASIKERFKAHAAQRISGLLGGGWGDKPLDALGKVDPTEFAETLIASLNDSGEKTAIIVDEVSFFFLALAEDDPKQAHTFAYRLRALQQRYANVRWLITGSIGLDTIARRYGLEGAFVDFETFVLEPFTPEQALSYMRDPVVRQQFNHLFDATDEDYLAMFADLGWLVPYYLRMIANEVRPSIPEQAGKPPQATRADLEAAMEKLLQPNRKSEFAIWREHVRKNLPLADREIAARALGTLSRDVDGETEQTLLAAVARERGGQDGGVQLRQLRDILAMLVNDALIAKVGDRYRFRSGLVRRYWREYEAD